MSSVQELIEETIAGGQEQAFFVVDVQDIIDKHKKWQRLLPRVRPFYAVKCNNMDFVVQLLTGLGLAFDCSSKAEIEAVLSCGVPPSDIIFANCCKSMAFINYAKNNSVDLMTFDNEDELDKISRAYPSARLLIRIITDDSYSSSRLSLKFGTRMEMVEPLLARAKALDLSVVGVAFHVGSGCKSTEPYSDAISKAREVFEIGRRVGHQMNVLDIGGGFPGQKSHNCPILMESIAEVINRELDLKFPENLFPHLTVLAEPGRYFVMSSMTLVTNVTSRRLGHSSDTNEGLNFYYLNDGLYGSFSSVITGKKIVEPIPVGRFKKDPDRELVPSVLWGPSCDSWDCIRWAVPLPVLEPGDWLMFRDMGSYSVAAASDFNGMPKPMVKYYFSQEAKKLVQEMDNRNSIEQIVGKKLHKCGKLK